MRKTLALVVSISILAPELGAYAYAANLAAGAARAVRVVPGGAASAGAGGVSRGGLVRPGSSGLAILPSGALYRPTGIVPSAALPGTVSAVVPAANARSFAPAPAFAFGRAAAAKPILPASGVRREANPGDARPEGSREAVSVQASLSAMERGFRERPGMESSPAAGKSRQDKIWNGAGLKNDAGGTEPKAEPDFGGRPRPMAGLKPSGARKGTKLRPFVALPLGIAAIAAAKVALGTAAKTTALGGWLDWIVALFASLPSWGQTGIQVAGAFAVASLAPRIVKAGMKWLFSWVEWDELRESYVTNVAAAAAWFSATGYAMMALGGAFSVTLNLTVFAAASVLALQELAKNLAVGYKFYASGKDSGMRVGRKVEIWDEKGRVEEINPRFTILDTSDTPESDYERVLMPNEKLKDKLLTTFPRKGTGLLAFAPLAFLPAALAGPIGFALQAGGSTLITLYLADIFNQKSRRWDEKARKALEEEKLDEFDSFSKRSSVMAWIRNGIYFSGLLVLLGMFGMPVEWTTFGMTVFSAAVGFYTKAVATDLVGGLMIAYWRPFGKGDFIEIAGAKGTVRDIDQNFLYLTKDEPGKPVLAIPLEKVMEEKIKIGRKKK